MAGCNGATLGGTVVTRTNHFTEGLCLGSPQAEVRRSRRRVRELWLLPDASVLLG